MSISLADLKQAMDPQPKKPKPYSAMEDVSFDLRVESGTKPGTYYTVVLKEEGWHCDCLGFNSAGHCKHVRHVIRMINWIVRGE